MSVQRRVNWISQQRVDLPDLRAIESAASNDFDQLIQAFVTGTQQGYFMRGFEISMSGAIGGASNNLQLIVDPGAVLHINASQSGTVLMVPAGTAPQSLNAATNTNVVGAFSPSSTNYVGIDYTRFLDDTTDAQVYLWNPSTDDETTIIAPRANILTYSIVISTTIFPPNILPIAVVTTLADNTVSSITDARWLLCRLGTGGPTPNPYYQYPWTAQPEGRTENPSTSTSNSVNPFEGGDKMLMNLKDWMNAIMTSIAQIQGTTYWYTATNSESITYLRQDLGNSVITGRGSISHGILPNSNPILNTTGNITLSSNQLTGLASTTGLATGQYIFGAGIPTNTTVLSIAGSTVTMSQEATATTTGVSVSFYDPSVITQPGQINWSSDIEIKVVGSALEYTLAANPTSDDITLADDQCAYITLVRDVPITPNLIFTNGSPTVTSVGAIAWTSVLQSGDYIKLVSDNVSGYYQILTVNSSSQVTLTTNFNEVSTGATGALAQYAFNTYTVSPTPSTNRNIYITSRETVPQGANVFWFLLREDNGGSVPKVYVRFLGSDLDEGVSEEISDTKSEQTLQYIGAPFSSSSLPMYVSALNPGSVPEIFTATTGAASTITSDQYFLFYSSGNARRYYGWFKKDGSGTDPMPANTDIGVEIDITTGQTAAQVATAIAVALSGTFFDDFSAVASSNVVTVTNNSAGTTSSPVNVNVGAPFAVAVSQSGTGTGNTFIQDGDNLTLAIKLLDDAIGNIAASLKLPVYDQTVTIVASGATPPTSLNGPIASPSTISLPLNSRLSNTTEKYLVGNGSLQVFLNGQYLVLGTDWSEVGAAGTLSSSITFLQPDGLLVDDVLEFRVSAGGGGAGGGGGVGPPGPAGPTGPAGHDAAGGPVAISTKTSNYTVMLSDNVLLANATSGAITFSLPAASSATGHVFYFKKIDSSGNIMTVLAAGSDLIDGFASLSTSVQYEAFTLITDGSEWYIF